MMDLKQFGARWGIWVAVAVASVAVVLLILVGGARKRAEAVPPVHGEAGELIVDVHVREVVACEAEDRLEIPGYLEPFADATISAEKGGRIVEMAVDKGDRVEEGQVLVRLNDRIWKAVAAQAEVQARETRKEWERWQELKDSGAVSPSDMDAVQKARDLAAAAYEEARVHVEQCVVKSPIAGVVADRYMELGEFAAEGGPLLRLVTVDRLKLMLDVPERDVAAVAVGRDVAFRVGRADRVFSGTVRFVSPAAAKGSNSFHTEVEVDNREGLLQAGMIASVHLVRRKIADAIVVPLDAVVNDEGEHIVFVVEEGRAVRRIVHIDAIQEQSVLLLDGLRAGDLLITDGQRSLQDGRKVKVVNP